MRRPPRLLFVVIFFLFLFALLVVLPKTVVIDFDSPKLPFINRSISLHRQFFNITSTDLLQRIGIRRDFVFKKGLDLEGGTSVTMRANMGEVPSADRIAALTAAREVIERRVNFFGVTEPIVQTATGNNDYRIVVELPGITDVNEAVQLIGRTAQLSYWEQVASDSAKLASPSAMPFGMLESLGPYVTKTDLTGKDLNQSAVIFDPNTGAPQVQLRFTGEGAKKFGEITKRNLGKPVAIVLDDVVITAPVVRSPILDGNGVISGNFTTQQAKQLTTQLNAGALPVSLTVLDQRAIGATLGEESLAKSIFAGIVGFFVIFVFMIVMYGRLGFIASVALLIYTLLVLSLFKLIPVTLTLAGIAGFILSIGMAVDANILIFERMKEELRKGRTRDIAIELGFSRAWTSIRDSNVASLITCAILYYFGSGMVRGFAVALAIGVLLSMFSAITVTRTFLRMTNR